MRKVFLLGAFGARMLTLLFRGLLLMMLGGVASAALPPLNLGLNEQVFFIRDAERGTELETTLFKPDGAGPFPLVVINHGKSAGDARQQERTRYPVAAREFVRRGYVVLIPMRGGFSRSTGPYVGYGCNISANGVAQARDLRVALDYAVKLPYVDRGRIVIVGQSHGGLTALAFGMRPYPGVLGLINFAGGLRMKSCPEWEDQLVQAFADYGRSNRYPSLWFYGLNDSFWSPALVERMYAAYRAGGGRATKIDVGRFKADAHALFRDREGLAVWWPAVEGFLAGLDLPTELRPHAERGDDPRWHRLLAAGRRLPESARRCRALYDTFLDVDYPRVFTLARDGRCALASGGKDLEQRALTACRAGRETPCALYVVDDEVRALP